ncbi:conserved phage C-terminal domain-containing protein [Levilactobacillus brevis]|uniref:conserved phage C-terminal domain-containing protein n=1 Tax=Levilactobacillus brevis TaxID=1580 RepID=UPI00339BF7CC
MQGWVKLYRELLEKPIWLLSTAGQRSVLIAVLMLANHSAKKWEWQGKPFEVQPGQFITSLPSLAEKSGKGTTVQMVRGSLARFSKLGFLTDQSTGSGRLITVVNWGIYQGEENRATDQSTDGQQTNNRPTTPNKNDKNVKKKEEAATPPEIHYKKILDLLNERADREFKNVKGNRDLIRSRIKEGYTEHDLALVIVYKCKEWKGDSQMEQYLRPTTLFGSSKNFSKYLDAARLAQRKQQRQSTSEPPVLTPEEGSARQADYMARLEKQYAKEGESNE